MWSLRPCLSLHLKVPGGCNRGEGERGEGGGERRRGGGRRRNTEEEESRKKRAVRRNQLPPLRKKKREREAPPPPLHSSPLTVLHVTPRPNDSHIMPSRQMHPQPTRVQRPIPAPLLLAPVVPHSRPGTDGERCGEEGGRADGAGVVGVGTAEGVELGLAGDLFAAVQVVRRSGVAGEGGGGGNRGNRGNRGGGGGGRG